MYETRQQQATLHQDENKRGELKAAKGNGKAPSLPAANSRRALGDIGNVVAAAAVWCKEGQAEVQVPEKKAVPPVIIDRSFGAQLASNNLPTADIEEEVSETNSSNNSHDDSSLEGKDVELEVSRDAVPSGRKKAHRNGRPAAAKQKRGRTLTATLTARSEAVSGGLRARVVEEPVVSIDAKDIGNQLAVVEYVEDIYSFYRKTEEQSCVHSDYMSLQTHINDKMRAILIDWLIEVHLKFKLMPETLFLSTNLIDRYLEVQSVERKNLQLVGITSLLVASKYEEIWAPEIQDFIFISDNAYTRDQILDMEKVMLNTLSFNLCVPTPYMFLVRFLKAASSHQQMNMLAFYFVELCLVNYKMVRFLPSMLAASAVYLAQCTLKPEGAHWSATLKHYSGFMESELIECASMMVTLHQDATRESNLTVVRRKYSHDKYSSVSLLSPPTLIISTTEDAAVKSTIK